MTDVKKDIAIAKAIGFTVKSHSKEDDEFWLFDEHNQPVMPLKYYKPTFNANQCIEALNTIFERWSHRTRVVQNIRYYHFFGSRFFYNYALEKKDFCEAGCDLILDAMHVRTKK